jgi:hypothetical protein
MVSYYENDINDSQTYLNSVRMHCDLMHTQTNTYMDAVNKTADYIGDGVATNMRCFKDPELEQNFKLDQYNLNYRCDPFISRDNQKDYSDCLGYACNREEDAFMYALDEFNTYHNYLVCKNKHDNDMITCCPENIQIFNNWTKRHMAYKPTRPKQDLFIEEQKIPLITYKRCYLY